MPERTTSRDERPADDQPSADRLPPSSSTSTSRLGDAPRGSAQRGRSAHLLRRESSNRPSVIALSVNRQRPVSRSAKRVTGHQTCSVGATSISGVMPTSLPCAETEHAPARRACKIAANELAGAEVCAGREVPPARDELGNYNERPAPFPSPRLRKSRAIRPTWGASHVPDVCDPYTRTMCESTGPAASPPDESGKSARPRSPSRRSVLLLVVRREVARCE